MMLGKNLAARHSSLNFAALAHDYMKTHAVHFNDPQSVEKHITARLVDDELRALWLDGLMQCQLHIRFLWQDILIATYGQYGYLEPSIYKNNLVPSSILNTVNEEPSKMTMGEAIEQFDFDTLIESILETKELGPMHCLSIAFGVYNIRVTRTMLANLRTLYDQLTVLTPYQRLKGFEAIPMADASLYQMPLIASKTDPCYARDGHDNATAAIYTIMETIPLGELWIEKHRALMKRIRQVTIL
ncbi:MAG: hypothetical protein J6V64_05260 [Burkholderiaceae bacterium]|nr:hypothetical protein [Burkholderiaceae bacterium]